MHSADVVVVGAGLVGLALARELDRQGLRAVVYEAGEAGHGASWAGAGMLSAHQLQHPAMRAMGIASARLYPTWIAELERETGLNAGYRVSGTLVLAPAEQAPALAQMEGWEPVADAVALEPELRPAPGWAAWRVTGDHSVDNRLLSAALLAALRARGVRVIEHTPVQAVEAVDGAGLSVTAGGERLTAPVVVNCSGAWAGAFPAPFQAPVRPRKGQLVALRTEHAPRHVVEAPGVYMVPRAGGRLLIGATLEDCGFDPEISDAAARRLHERATSVIPALASARQETTWIGYRPGTPDDLPLLGPTPVAGYWLATGHFRDGILLAPITAKIVASALIKGHLTTALDLAPFRPERFTATAA